MKNDIVNIVKDKVERGGYNLHRVDMDELFEYIDQLESTVMETLPGLIHEMQEIIALIKTLKPST